MVSGLAEALAQRGWEHKEELYAECLEEVRLLCPRREVALSVIIVAWRFQPEILENLRALKQTGGMDFELVLVNNGAAAESFSPLEPHADVLVRLNRNTGAYLSRNLGALFASGPILLFVDDDGLPQPGFVREHRRAFEEYEALSVRGVCRPLTDNPLNGIAGHYHLGDAPYPRFADLEGNTSYLASAFYALGGWNDAIRFGHGGIELGYRLWRMTGRPELQIYHPGPVLGHDYIADEQGLAVKRAKQAKAWRYVQTMHPDIDAFMKLWEGYKGREDLLVARREQGLEAEPDAQDQRVRSLLNLAEHYLVRGEKEKGQRYLAKARALSEGAGPAPLNE